MCAVPDGVSMMCGKPSQAKVQGYLRRATREEGAITPPNPALARARSSARELLLRLLQLLLLLLLLPPVAAAAAAAAALGGPSTGIEGTASLPQTNNRLHCSPLAPYAHRTDSCNFSPSSPSSTLRPHTLCNEAPRAVRTVIPHLTYRFGGLTCSTPTTILAPSHCTRQQTRTPQEPRRSHLRSAVQSPLPAGISP